jgi:hypothetical protein
MVLEVVVVLQHLVHLVLATTAEAAVVQELQLLQVHL